MGHIQWPAACDPSYLCHAPLRAVVLGSPDWTSPLDLATKGIESWSTELGGEGLGELVLLVGWNETIKCIYLGVVRRKGQEKEAAGMIIISRALSVPRSYSRKESRSRVARVTPTGCLSTGRSVETLRMLHHHS